VWPRVAPAELVTSLLQAVDDDNSRVRLEAIYAAGIVARAPLPPADVERLKKALDHYDPAVRAGAARVIGRVGVSGTAEALLKAVNDSQADVRYAAMRALGSIRDQRAVSALSDQLAFYKKGEGAYSAIQALAQIASPASIPVFRERLADKDPFIRRAAAEGLGRTADAESMDALETLATTDDSSMVRLAGVFALQKLGRAVNLGRIADLMASPKVTVQGQDYLVELGPAVAPTAVARLQDPDADVREAMADVLGAVGDESSIAALETAAKDRDPSVAAAAKRAIARLRAPQQ
jgi:HEAT repeat protein